MTAIVYGSLWMFGKKWWWGDKDCLAMVSSDSVIWMGSEL